jgi:hypothetical protein
VLDEKVRVAGGDIRFGIRFDDQFWYIRAFFAQQFALLFEREAFHCLQVTFEA